MNKYEQFLDYLYENAVPEWQLKIYEDQNSPIGLFPDMKYRFEMETDYLERTVGVSIFPDDNGNSIYGSDLIDGFVEFSKYADSSTTPYLSLYDCSKTYIPGYTSPGFGDKRTYFIGSDTEIISLGDNVFELRRNAIKHFFTGFGNILSGGSGV